MSSKWEIPLARGRGELSPTHDGHIGAVVGKHVDESCAGPCRPRVAKNHDICTVGTAG